MMNLHATCLAFQGKGILLLGDSGSGKSDLALRLMEVGAALVADDQVLLEAVGGAVYASPPPKIAGLLEVRGIGLIPVPHLARTGVDAAFQLVAELPERLPEAQYYDCLGHPIPLFYLHAYEPSAVAKIKLALWHAVPASTAQEAA